MSANYVSRERADAIWTLLVNEAGATEDDRPAFVGYLMEPNQFGHEYRFMGSLGTGGKLYTYSPRPGAYVGCYPEHRTPERSAIIAAVNLRLDELFGTQR